MLHVKTIFFDFDGTIADTLSASIALVNKHADSYGWRKIKPEEINHLRSLTVPQLLKEFKIPFYTVPFLLRKFQSELYQEMSSIKLFPGIKHLLKELKKKDLQLGIITTNTQHNVSRCLEANSVSEFDFIHSERSIFGKSASINKVMKAQKLVADQVMYIGDEVRDIRASTKSGIRCIAVTWGYNSKELLQHHYPYATVDSPAELLNKLMSLDSVYKTFPR